MRNSIRLTPKSPPVIKETAKTEMPSAKKGLRKANRWQSGFKGQSTPVETPSLRFSPTAWAKLVFLRDYGDTEVGGFGISAQDDLLYIEDVVLVRQTCTGMSVAFDDASVADFFDGQVDQGRKIEQFARIWVHTHPGDCPRPSGTDEDTFLRVFGRNDWAVIFILAQGGQSYARLNFGVGPGGNMQLSVAVDYSRPFTGSDYGVWEEEYLANVQALEPVLMEKPLGILAAGSSFDDRLGLTNTENRPFFGDDDFWNFLECREETYGS
jgi:hypothetical protein